MKPSDRYDWIHTFTNRKVRPLDPTPESIAIEDIAHALSNVCRFTGHVKRFYSVAEHSVRVSRLVHVATGDLVQSLWGLLHDASEAYLSDIASPVKRTAVFDGYRRAERHLMNVICARFQLSVEEPQSVREADLKLLATEREHLFGPAPAEWGLLPEPVFVADYLGWSPAAAEELFLRRFRVLSGQIEDDARRAAGGES